MSGVYITGHPLDDYREQLQRFPFSTADLEDLEEAEDHGQSLDGRLVDMAGILTEVKGKATKKGAYMGFLTLEDLSGSIECLVFPKVFERYQGTLAADDLVVLTGKLSVSEEDAPKLLVDRVTPLEQWKPQAPRQYTAGRPLTPPPPGPDPFAAPSQPTLSDAQLAAKSPRKLYIRLARERMDECTHALSLHPGSVPVYLHVPQEKLTFIVPRISWCDASEACLKRLKGLFGNDDVKLVEK